MSDLHRARARAETFAHAVDDGPRHSSRVSDDDPEVATAVELAGRLRTAGAVVPRPEFTAELRHRLLEQVAARAATPSVVHSSPDSLDEAPGEADEAAVTQLRPRRGRRIRLVAGTAALVMLGGGIGSAAAAQQAMPGDALYGVKRGIENVSTNVSMGDDSRGRRELEHAMSRLSELRALVGNGGSVATINRTVDDFSIQARRGVSRLVASYQQDSDLSSITAITTFLTAAGHAISELAPKLPPESLEPAVEALATIEQLARHTHSACPTCAKPVPVKPSGRTTVATPGGDPSHQPNGDSGDRPGRGPSRTSTTPARPSGPASTSAGASTTPSPGQHPSTSDAAGQQTPLPPREPSTPSGSPSGPTTSSPSRPLVPTLPLPLPSLPITLPPLLPPWR
jgi:hypothetical protein